MNLRAVRVNGTTVAVVEPACGEKIIIDARSAFDLAMTVRQQAETDRFAIPKAAIADEFFILSSGIAGDVLQKYINYHVKIAIFGDFSRYTSKPLHDFMYESNNGRDVFFVGTEREAIDRLGRC